MNYLFVTSMVGNSTINEVRTCSTVLLVLLQCFLEFPGVLCLNATPFSDYSVSGRHRSPPRYQLIIIIINNGVGKSAPVRRCGAYLPQLCGETFVPLILQHSEQQRVSSSCQSSCLLSSHQRASPTFLLLAMDFYPPQLAGQSSTTTSLEHLGSSTQANQQPVTPDTVTTENKRKKRSGNSGKDGTKIKKTRQSRE